MAKISLELGDRFWCRAAGDNTTRYGIVTSHDAATGFIISGSARQGYTMNYAWIPDDFQVTPATNLPAAVKLALDAVERALGLGSG